jgi:hypothetical protein
MYARRIRSEGDWRIVTAPPHPAGRALVMRARAIDLKPVHWLTRGCGGLTLHFAIDASGKR